MNKIKAIIIDDEGHCRETLEWELGEHCPQVEVLDKCASAYEGMYAIQQQQPDLVFLDIEMPKMNGFEMLKALGEVDFKVVFTTAYDQFAIKAFRVSALDYLLKPIDGDLLKQAVAKMDATGAPLSQNAQLDLLLKQLGRTTPASRVALPTADGLEMVETQEILHCESDSNYTNMHFESGRKLVISRTLKDIEELLKDFGFLRVHNSALINLAHVRKYVKGDGGYVVLSDGSHINVSRSRKQRLLDALH